MNQKEKLLKDWNGGIARGAQRKLAEKLQLNEASVSSWLSGRAMPSEGNILKMSRIFGKSSEEIETIFVQERKNAAVDIALSAAQSAKDIPVMPCTPVKKDFFILGQMPEVYLPVKKDAGDKTFAIKIYGDYMADPQNPKASLYEGDYAVINTGPAPEGAVALARINKEYCTLKRYYPNEGAVELVSDNPKYKPQSYDLYQVEILGYVAHIHRPAPIKLKNS